MYEKIAPFEVREGNAQWNQTGAETSGNNATAKPHGVEMAVGEFLFAHWRSKVRVGRDTHTFVG